eukprot:TRINITY_DN534_c0_g2_i3.p1 TRINITY_DN534_c0_g2~~TRINITY_DN534_c0_g2_i3.p1  ORF type:complete len:129 (-),score=8.90 TRINITY_DN534_c0_g2_i3:13-399(-)
MCSRCQVNLCSIHCYEHADRRRAGNVLLITESFICCNCNKINQIIANSDLVKATSRTVCLCICLPLTLPCFLYYCLTNDSRAEELVQEITKQKYDVKEDMKYKTSFHVNGNNYYLIYGTNGNRLEMQI